MISDECSLNETYKYYILSFVIGALHKIYDDLYDNDLYEYFNINENKIYVNETLKILFVLGFSIISMEFIFFYFWYVILNIILRFLKKTDYGPYEFSGLVSSCILLPFLKWKLEKKYQYNIIFIILAFFFTYIIEKCSVNIEYSFKKLITRFILIIIVSLVLLINIKFLFSKSLSIILLFIIGYCGTSCIFQYILLTKDKQLTFV